MFSRTKLVEFNALKMSFTITICVINIALGEPAPSIWNAFEAHSLNTHIQLEQLNKCGLVPIIWVLLETSWLQSIVYLSTIVNTISYKSFNLFSISIPLKRTLIICMINDHENLVIVFMKNFLGTGLFIVLSLKNGRKFSLVEGGGCWRIAFGAVGTCSLPQDVLNWRLKCTGV